MSLGENPNNHESVIRDTRSLSTGLQRTFHTREYIQLCSAEITTLRSVNSPRCMEVFGTSVSVGFGRVLRSGDNEHRHSVRCLILAIRALWLLRHNGEDIPTKFCETTSRRSTPFLKWFVLSVSKSPKSHDSKLMTRTTYKHCDYLTSKQTLIRKVILDVRVGWSLRSNTLDTMKPAKIEGLHHYFLHMPRRDTFPFLTSIHHSHI